MKKRKLLLWLHVKMAFCSLPKMFFSALIFGGLLAVTAFFFMQYGEKEEDDKNTIAVVLPENSDQYTRLAFKFLGEIDTVKNLCDFIQMDEESAINGMKEGTIFAIILLPDEFVKHILNGTNTPAEIIIPENGLNSQSIMFRELIEAGAGDLSAAQAGIYAVSDVCGNYRLQHIIPEAEEYLNKEYFSYVLDRTAHFDTVEVSAYNGMSSVQFYIGSGITAFFLFCGIFCVNLFKRENNSFTSVLMRENITMAEYSAFRVFGVSLVYAILTLTAWIMLRLACIRFDVLRQFVPEFTLVTILGMFVLIYSLFSMIHFIFQIMNSQTAGILLLLLVTTVSLFISGALIPSALLPRGVQALSRISPVTQYLQLSRQITVNMLHPVTIVTNVIWAAVFICLPAVVSGFSANITSYRKDRD